MSPRRILWRGLVAGLCATLVSVGALLAYVGWYSKTNRIFPGVAVGGAPVGGLTRSDALRRPAPAGDIRLYWGDRTWSLREWGVGVEPDVNAAVQTAQAVGRSGGLWRRANQFLTGLVHGHYVPYGTNLRQEALVLRLEELALELNRRPVDASYDFASDTTRAEAPGQALDVPATVQAVRRAMKQRRSDVELVVRPVAPTVTTADLKDAGRHEIARFTTPILAADPGRVQNIAIAVRKIDGVALKPGQIFSFNELVGPRDAEHGWAQAKELYQGEFVLGYGGGICQVSSTLYNSVLLGGLEIKERYHHDRPLQYVDPGRDATVAWKVLDFRFRNSSDSMVVVGARILPGTPQQIEVALYAPKPPAHEAINLETADVRYFPPALEEVLDPALPANVRQVLDEGHYGIEVKIYRIFRDGGQNRRELVSHDRYQPKAGKVKVGVGNAPGSDRLLDPGVR